MAAESATFCEIFVQRGLPLEALGGYVLARSLSPVRAKEIATPGTRVSMEWTVEGHRGRVGAVVSELPFLDLPRKRA